MSGALCRAGISLSAVVACLALADTGHARQPADGQEAAPRWLSLYQVDAFLELESEFRYDRVDTKIRRGPRGSRSQTNRDLRFEERIGLSLGGTLIDPSFITFAGELSFGLSQDRYEEFGTHIPTRRDHDNNFQLRYDGRMNFFSGKPLSGSVYAVRRDDRISRRFQSTLTERRSGFGTNWVFSDETLPMELTFDYVHTDRTGNRDARDDEEYDEATLYYGTTWNIDKHHRLKFSYNHSETQQEFQGRRNQFETTRDLFKIDHELEFGDQKQHELRTSIHWQEEAGDFARDFFEIGPQLTLKHTDDLQTRYQYQFNRERYAGLDIESQLAQFQLTHQAYTNLTSTFTLFGLYEDIEDDINTTQYGASADWQYNRRNPYGHLYANLAVAWDTERVTGDNGARISLDEAHTFRDPLSIQLRNRNVIPYSIIVTDTTNRRVFTPGLDYVVYRQRDVTRIARLRNGMIADKSTVLVDYQFRTPTRGDIDTLRVDLGIEQRFTNGWTPYYRLSFRNQEDEPSFGFPNRADRTEHHRMAARYETKRYTVGAEYEIFEDLIDPYNAYHLDGLVHLIREQDHTLDGSVRFSRLMFDGDFDDRNVTMIDIELDHRLRIGEHSSLIDRLSYRIEDDSIAGETQGWDVAIGVEYIVGDLSCEVTAEYDRLSLPGSDDEDFGLYVRIRRDLRDVFELAKCKWIPVAASAWLAVAGGCARPAGPLFDPLDQRMVWPAAPDEPRISLLGIMSGSGSLNASQSGGEVFLKAMRGARPPIRFSGPHAVAISGTSMVAVADGSGNALHIIDLDARLQTVVIGWGEERLGTPVGVAWVGRRLFVTDATRGEVIEFDLHGSFKRRFGGDVLKRPVGIAFLEGRDELCVVDGGHHRLAVFTTGGRHVRSVGGPGVAPGQFNYPTHVASFNGRLLVADSGNFRVQLLDGDGTCLRLIGRKGNGAGDFSLPKGVAFDAMGRLYVVDAQFENVQVFDNQGQLLMAFGQEGFAPGRFSLPAGLAIDERGWIWVAEAGNRRLQVFEQLKASS